MHKCFQKNSAVACTYSVNTQRTRCVQHLHVRVLAPRSALSCRICCTLRRITYLARSAPNRNTNTRSTAVSNIGGHVEPLTIHHPTRRDEGNSLAVSTTLEREIFVRYQSSNTSASPPAYCLNPVCRPTARCIQYLMHKQQQGRDFSCNGWMLLQHIPNSTAHTAQGSQPGRRTHNLQNHASKPHLWQGQNPASRGCLRHTQKHCCSTAG